MIAQGGHDQLLGPAVDLGDLGLVRLPVHVEVAVREPVDGAVLVDEAVAVIVERVADLEEPGAHVATTVVAVAPATACAVAPRVAAGGVVFPVPIAVHRAEGARVAVLVAPLGIADLGVAWETIRVRVVAVVAPATDGQGPVPIRIGDGAAGRGAGRVLLRAEEILGAGSHPEDAPHRVRPRGSRVAGLGAVAKDSVVAVGVRHAKAERGVPHRLGGRVGAAQPDAQQHGEDRAERTHAGSIGESRARPRALQTNLVSVRA